MSENRPREQQTQQPRQPQQHSDRPRDAVTHGVEADGAAAVRLREVSLEYGDFRALNAVSLDIPLGATTAIMGPSGCGKTSLLRCAAGLVTPDTGTVGVLGAQLERAPEREITRLRSEMGFVFQHGALWQNMTILRNLLLPLETHHPELSSSAQQRLVEAEAHRFGVTSLLPLRPAQVSGGGQKLIAYLRATMLQPRLLFLDEPTSFLDGRATELLKNDLKRRIAAGCTVVMVTHESNAAALIADRLVVMDNGSVLASGPISEVTRSSNVRVREILEKVLSETAVYDQDILTLLDADEVESSRDSRDRND